MCRIAAIVSENILTLESRIKSMADSMQHGGPDDFGHFVHTHFGFALGHRRLSIVDLSENGRQPMCNNLHNVYITFNGEIYNYKELKDELKDKGYLFNNESDTEVLIYGYQEWGSDVINRLKGMFAFVLVDIAKQILFAARDHAGIKPLYIGKRGGDIYFSSEVKGFLAVDPAWEQNSKWPIWFLTYGFLPEPITTLNKVEPLPRGHYFLIDLKTKKFSTHKYYEYEYKNIKIPYFEAVEKARRLLVESVKRHMVADVPVGVFLSGGVDSSILTLLAQKQQLTPIETLSIYFDDEKYSENYYQQLMIAKTGVKHHTYKVNLEEFLETWPEIYKSLDQPSSDAINTHFICKYAHQNGLKVVLSGIGADELFGGYPSFNRALKFHKYNRLAVLTKLLPGSIIKSYPNRKIIFLKNKISSKEYLLYRGLFTPEDVAEILDISKKNVIDELSKISYLDEIEKLSPQNKASYLESSIFMQSQLLKDSDMQSMWYGLELRVPFLDIDLMSYINNLHPEIKYQNNRHKPLLIDAFINELPEAVWNRPKQGFTFPFENWFNQMEVFTNSGFVPNQFYNSFKKERLNFSRIWAIFLSRVYGSLNSIKSADAYKKTENIFLYLTAFDNTGGIEKVNKSILKSLAPNEVGNTKADAWSLYDKFVDTRYFPRYAFKSSNGSKIKFLWKMYKNANQWNKYLIGHINLAPAAWLIKYANKNAKITLVAHGIDVWGKQKGLKYWLLKNADSIISVSNFTKKKLVEVNQVSENKIKVLPNCLDSYFKPSFSNYRANYLLNKHGLKEDDFIILTVSRLKSTEKYKGYDSVLRALKKILEKNDFNKSVKYLLCGKYDSIEFARITQLIDVLKLNDVVVLTGFIEDDELMDYYQLANVFIMPSQKEGFGIVFIEAAAHGTQVIAGNGDGSSEALQFGKFGILVDPENNNEIEAALLKSIQSPESKSQSLSQEVQEFYGFKKYKTALTNMLIQN